MSTLRSVGLRLVHGPEYNSFYRNVILALCQVLHRGIGRYIFKQCIHLVVTWLFKVCTSDIEINIFTDNVNHGYCYLYYYVVLLTMYVVLLTNVRCCIDKNYSD